MLVLLRRRRHPYTIGRIEFHARDLANESYILKSRPLPRLSLKFQDILVFEYLLYSIQIGLKAYRTLVSQEIRFAPRLIGELGNAILSVGRFPKVAVHAANPGKVDRVDDGARTLGDAACRIH